jgi:excisionase family DNA binding protein
MNTVTNRERQREYMSVAEIALKLGVSAPTIRRRIEDGSLHAVKLGEDRNSPVRVSKRSLAAWLEQAGEPGDEAA